MFPEWISKKRKYTNMSYFLSSTTLRVTKFRTVLYLQMHVKEALIPSKTEPKTPFYVSVVSWERIHCTLISSKQIKKRKRITKGTCSKNEEEENLMGKITDKNDDEAAWRKYVKSQFQTIHDNHMKLEKLLVGVMEKLEKTNIHEVEEDVIQEPSMEAAKSNEDILSNEGEHCTTLICFDDKLATFEDWMKTTRRVICPLL